MGHWTIVLGGGDSFFPNPSYAVGVIFYDFLVFFGTLIDVFPGNLEYVEFKTACSPDQVT